jgi:hypothetical protein
MRPLAGKEAATLWKGSATVLAEIRKEARRILHPASFLPHSTELRQPSADESSQPRLSRSPGKYHAGASAGHARW